MYTFSSSHSEQLYSMGMTDCVHQVILRRRRLSAFLYMEMNNNCFCTIK